MAALTLDGTGSQLVWQARGTWQTSLAWQKGALYALATEAEKTPKRPVTTAHLLRWRPGERGAAEIALVPYPNAEVIAAGGTVLLWPARQYRKEQYQIADTPLPFRRGVVAVEQSGRLHPLPADLSSTQFVERNTFATVDESGRLITLEGTSSGRRVLATDVRTGGRARIYP